MQSFFIIEKIKSTECAQLFHLYKTASAQLWPGKKPPPTPPPPPASLSYIRHSPTHSISTFQAKAHYEGKVHEKGVRNYLASWLQSQEEGTAVPQRIGGPDGAVKSVSLDFKRLFQSAFRPTTAWKPASTPTSALKAGFHADISPKNRFSCWA